MIWTFCVGPDLVEQTAHVLRDEVIQAVVKHKAIERAICGNACNVKCLSKSLKTASEFGTSGPILLLKLAKLDNWFKFLHGCQLTGHHHLRHQAGMATNLELGYSRICQRGRELATE